MKAYADTNFYTSALTVHSRHEIAWKLLENVASGASEPLPVPLILRLEIVNALQRMVFECRHSFQTYRLTTETASVSEAVFFDRLADGNLWRNRFVFEDELQSRFANISHRHTAKHGFRTYDILHVSTALMLGCDTFWSFDEKTKKLAVLERMKTNCSSGQYAFRGFSVGKEGDLIQGDAFAQIGRNTL